jgi:hypothetical protein
MRSDSVRCFGAVVLPCCIFRIPPSFNYYPTINVGILLACHFSKGKTLSQFSSVIVKPLQEKISLTTASTSVTNPIAFLLKVARK